jgi:LPXTG-site transpeptidase (sortase) family protein
MDSLRLQIPDLKVDVPIIGVPRLADSWDVSWLGNDAGWLDGSAFPTWQGNTVLTGHVWNADNTPGIFVNLKDLQYGDRFEIQAYGQTYTYEVRENTLISKGNVYTVFKHKDLDWVTLLSCEQYDPGSGNYPFRRLVRAILVDVE